MSLLIARTTVWVVMFSGLCWVALGQSQRQGRTGVNDQDQVAETDDLVGAWLNMIDRAEGAWIPHPDLASLADGSAVKQDSEKWCGTFFKTEVNPHLANPTATLTVHEATADTADLIRYDYGASGMRLRVYESVDFAVLRIEEADVDILKLSQDKRSAAIAAVAARLLAKPATANGGAVARASWPFKFPQSVEDGSRFSTDASQEPLTMPSWTSRVDGGIHAGHLYFLCFKTRQSGDGRLILLNSHHWFDGQAWAPYERPKGR